MAETIALVAPGVIGTLTGAAATARATAQALPRTVREQQVAQQQRAQQRARQATTARERAQRAALATTTDPGLAPTGRALLAGAARGTQVTPPPPSVAGAVAPTALGRAAATRPVPVTLGRSVTRPSPVPPSAAGGGGIDIPRTALLAQLAGGPARGQVQMEPETVFVTEDPTQAQRRREARLVESRRATGRRGNILAPSLGSVSELVSERATLLGR